MTAKPEKELLLGQEMIVISTRTYRILYILVDSLWLCQVEEIEVT